MPATGPKNITTAKLKTALRKHAGIYVLAAKELGCERQNVAARVARSPDLQRFVASIDEEVGDLADSIIIDTLGRRDIAGKPTKDAQGMARWLRDHRLRKVGLKLRLEHTGADGAPLPAPHVKVEISYVDAPDGPDLDEIPA